MGQAGVQVGNAVWELFCLEHSVYPNGLEAHPTPDKGEAIFFLNPNGKSIPRAVFCDLEPTPIDEIRTGSYRQLFNPDMMVTGKEDAASNFARGYYSIGNQMSDLFMDRVRRCAEICESLQGFAVFRSYGGGTGSGFVANVLNKLKKDFRSPIIEFSIYPSPRISPLIVEPYNTVLTTHATINNVDCSFLFDNEAIYDICAAKLDINEPTYTNLNRLIAQVRLSSFISIILNRTERYLSHNVTDEMPKLVYR
ncbi:hypothetical protein O3M35_006313 [Rhynocoris fuscipes]|uniref:Tubulin alpha chain n=1 Tax=Rhynocoris fuscipes TaxID=488301 RepID=A0AAW1DED4_9HEMI